VVAAAVFGRFRAGASEPLEPAPPGPAPVFVFASVDARSTLLVAGRFCLAGFAGSGRLTQTADSLKRATAERLLVSSLDVAAVGEKATIGLDVSRREHDAEKRLRTSCTVRRSAG